MNRIEFEGVLKRYRNQQCTEEEVQLVDQLYDLLGKEEVYLAEEAEDANLQERMWLAIKRQTQPTPILPLSIASERTKRHFRWQWAVAASLVLAFMLGIWWVQKNGGGLNPNPTEIANTTQAPLKVHLKDGSVITLMPQGHLQIGDGFGVEKRAVSLKGDAFFDVAKDPLHPFVIQTEALKTQVLGTQFWIRHVLDGKTRAKNITVEVVSGKVSVARTPTANKPKQELTLTSNLKATYVTKTQDLMLGLVDQPILVRGSNGHAQGGAAALSFKFDDTPLSDVLRLLAQAYGIQIELVHKEVGRCPISADLTRPSLYEKLDLIGASLNGSYEVRGTTIYVTGGQCE